MFLLTNECNFEMNGISVSVPANYYIDGSPDYTHKDCLVFLPRDKKFEVSYEIIREKGTKEAILECEMGYASYKDFPPIEEIELNGLKGHHATYGNNRYQYYDVRFLIEKGVNENIDFAFSIQTVNQDIEELKASPEIRELLNSIRRKNNID